MAERDSMRKPEHGGSTPATGRPKQDWKEPQPVGDPAPGQRGVRKRIEDPKIDDLDIDDPEDPEIEDREIEDPDIGSRPR